MLRFKMTRNTRSAWNTFEEIRGEGSLKFLEENPKGNQLSIRNRVGH